MGYPRLEIREGAIRHNARLICGMCAGRGIEVIGVTKGVCGHPAVARAMLAGGAAGLGDSRLSNLRRMRRAGIAARLMLLRSPMPSEVEDVPAIADCSLESEPEVARALGERAASLGRVHGVTLMVDVGERREGVMPDRAVEVAVRMASLKGIRLEAVGTAVGCFNAVLPSRRNMQLLVEIAREASRELGYPLGVSGGTTATLRLLSEGELPEGVTQFRVGEGILLGTDITSGCAVPGARRDGFRLLVEVIEVQRKPSAPCGERGAD
ncbi:MAG: alanine racemase, partial [Firmicutes bacterium]|nr:alanine racemase [Bacillota bacterium]